MKKNIKKFILLLLHFFFFCYLIYSSKDIKDEIYIKLLSFLSLETLIISIFFIFKKDNLFSSTKIFFCLLSFFIVIFLNYLGIDHLAFSIIIIILIELPILLYLFIFLYYIFSLFAFSADIWCLETIILIALFRLLTVMFLKPL